MTHLQLLDTDSDRDDYLRGQQLQWALFCDAASRPARAGRSPGRGTRVEVVVDGRPSVGWIQDDPERRTYLVERADGPVLVCPEHRAVRVDGHWYTGVPQGRQLPACA